MLWARPGAVLEAEALDGVAKFGEGGRGRATSKAGAYDDDGVLPLIGWIYQLHFELAPLPGRFIGPEGSFALSGYASKIRIPAMTAMGMEMKPSTMRIEKMLAKRRAAAE